MVRIHPGEPVTVVAAPDVRRLTFADGLSADFDVSRPPVPQEREHEVLLAVYRALRPRVAVEVGTLYGTFTVLLAYWAEGARVYGIDRHAEWCVPMLEAWGVRDRVTLLNGDSRETIPLLPDGIGFAFQDADHSRAGVRSDFDLLWPKMAPGGVIAFHDVWPATEADQMSYNSSEVREAVRDLGLPALHVPWGQGIALVQKPLALDPGARGTIVI